MTFFQAGNFPKSRLLMRWCEDKPTKSPRKWKCAKLLGRCFPTDFPKRISKKLQKLGKICCWACISYCSLIVLTSSRIIDLETQRSKVSVLTAPSITVSRGDLVEVYFDKPHAETSSQLPCPKKKQTFTIHISGFLITWSLLKSNSDHQDYHMSWYFPTVCWVFPPGFMPQRFTQDWADPNRRTFPAAAKGFRLGMIGGNLRED